MSTPSLTTTSVATEFLPLSDTNIGWDVKVSLCSLIFHAEFDMIYKGSDATEREGAVWVVSDHLDHPGPLLFHKPKRISPATASLIKLRLQTVSSEP